MGQAFTQYFNVKDESGQDKVIYMAWAAYFDPVLEKLMPGPLVSLAIHDVDPDAPPHILHPAHTGETERAYDTDPELREKIVSDWLKTSRL